MTDHLSFTHDELVVVAERESQTMLGVSYQQALEMVDRGDLDGTIAEAELKMLRFLLS